MTSGFSIGNPFIELQQVGSTNNYATGLVHAGMAQAGAAVFAHHQTSGKGQRTKTWVSEPQKNIAISIILQPAPITLSQAFLLSMATAIGTQRFFNAYAGGDTKIKWPNDIYWRDRKAAGILIENILQGNNWKWAVIGIGINVNQTVFDAFPTNPTSLKQITEKDFDPLSLAKELCGYLQKSFNELLHSGSGIAATYKSMLYKLNEQVVLKKDSRVFNAVVKEVTTAGQLVVEAGTEERFDVGDVEWMI